MTRSKSGEQFSREFPDRPLLGVGVIIADRDQVLLVQRGSEPLKGYWSVPGGLVELGETVREAAVREVLEETGLELTVSEVVDVVDRIERDASGAVRYHFVLIDFLATPSSALRSRIPQASSDVSDVRWVKWDSVAEYRITPGLDVVLAKARRIAGEHDQMAGSAVL